MRRSIIVISVLLLVACAYMYINMSQTQMQLQSPAVDFTAENKTPGATIQNNPYVVRHGSNEMPTGMAAGGVLEGQQSQGIEPGGASTYQTKPNESGGQASSNPAQASGQSSAQPNPSSDTQNQEQTGGTTPGIDVEKGEGIEPGGFSDSGQSNVP